LPSVHQAKARVIFQSTRTRQTLPKTTRHLRVVMVGHLREEKDPLTLMAAARLLPTGSGILIDHIGASLDTALGQAARATQAQCPHYRWIGALPHRVTLQRIQRAHLLVHCSRMEGGAHVLMEAMCSGTPVLASRIDGNMGLLGEDYPGVFEPGDAQGLADLLLACRQSEGVTHWWRTCSINAPCAHTCLNRRLNALPCTAGCKTSGLFKNLIVFLIKPSWPLWKIKPQLTSRLIHECDFCASYPSTPTAP
jgi:hypothetical protein